jgi:hypothetical protein
LGLGRSQTTVCSIGQDDTEWNLAVQMSFIARAYAGPASAFLP